MYITIMKMVLGADKNAFLEDEVGTRLCFFVAKNIIYRVFYYSSPAFFVGELVIF